MRNLPVWVVFLIITLVSAACGSPAGPLNMLGEQQDAAGGAHEPKGAPGLAGQDGCPVTRPPNPPFIPPEPWPAQPPGQVSGPDTYQFWYGSPELWTALPKDGSWPQLGRGEKFWWWSERFDVNEDDTPDLVVTARRLDGEAPEFSEDHATNGYHHTFHWAMLVVVELPTPGCWEVTGVYKEQALSIVVWVPEEQPLK